MDKSSWGWQIKTNGSIVTEKLRNLLFIFDLMCQNSEEQCKYQKRVLKKTLWILMILMQNIH